jgi:UDP-glucose 6-dehydrogenase
MRIGIAGVGVIGGALERWLKEYTEHKIKLYDPPIGKTDSLLDCEAVFICVPVPTVGRAQDTSILEEVLKTECDPGQRVFIRSTVLPGTSDRLGAKHGLKVFSMPEFLTERIPDEDFVRQDIICGADLNHRLEQHVFLTNVFAGQKDIKLLTNTEAELAKYMHNGNGTVKVAFNNLIYQLCNGLGADYARVREAALMSGYVGYQHTRVPGPDGKLGYGGKCFPKDMEALIGECLRLGIPCDSLAHMQSENERIRGGAA